MKNLIFDITGITIDIEKMQEKGYVTQVIKEQVKPIIEDKINNYILKDKALYDATRN